MQRLTAIIPVYNEEQNLEDCLRGLTWADRAIRAPLGLLWLGLLLVMALPVAAYMSLLYYTVRLARSAERDRIAPRRDGEAPGRRVA